MGRRHKPFERNPLLIHEPEITDPTQSARLATREEELDDLQVTSGSHTLLPRYRSVMTRPGDLARELGIDPKRLRSWLRDTYPRFEPGARWELSPDQVDAARKHWATGTSIPLPRAPRSGRFRATSDEAYVLDLLDAIIGAKSQRQHTFDWLLGDQGRSSNRARLPVDAYWPEQQLVAEYRERQHSESTPFFDKPTVMTVSGVDRGEQRRRYDARRGEVIPAHGLSLLVVNADQLACDARGRLRRARGEDQRTLGTLLRELNITVS